MSLRIRRGGGSTPTQGGEVFGPSDGRAVVIAGVGPRTVPNPGGGISFNSSGSLQNAVDLNAAGSTFVCSSTAPLWTSAVNTGTKAPTIIFPGTVGQIVIDGRDSNYGAFDLGNNSTVIGGTFQNFGAAAAGDVHALRAAGGTAVSIRDVVVTGAKVSGVALGPSSHLSYSRLASNGKNGYQGNGHNMEVDHCEVTGNNVNLNSPANEGGAGKILFSGNGHFHHNYSHDNIGFGPWWDTGNYAWLIEENVIESEDRSGFFYEASYGGTVVRHNYIADCGVSTVIGGQSHTFENCVQLRVADSDSTNPAGPNARGQVQYNILDFTLTQSANLGGLLLMYHHAGGTGTSTTRTLLNWDVHHNQLWLRSPTWGQRVGGEDTGSVGTDVWDADIDFFTNEYRVASTTATYWKWDITGGSGIAKTWAQWQAFGQDTDGTRTLI